MDKKTTELFASLIRNAQLIACHANTIAPYGCYAVSHLGSVDFVNNLRPTSKKAVETLRSWRFDVARWARVSQGVPTMSTKCAGFTSWYLYVGNSPDARAIGLRICQTAESKKLVSDARCRGFEITREYKEMHDAGMNKFERQCAEQASGQWK